MIRVLLPRASRTTRVLLAISWLALPATGALAADLTVPGQYPTIQAAIDASSDGDRILATPGNYFEQLVIGDQAIEIAGDGGAVIVDGLEIGITIEAILDPGTVLTLRGVTITGSLDQENTSQFGAGMQVFGGTLQMFDCVVDANDHGVWISGGEDHWIQNCTFRDNWRNGLTFFAADGITTIRNCLFTDNHTFSAGAGLYIGGTSGSNTGQVTIDRCEFDQNEAEFVGAGAFFTALANVEMTQTLFTNNVSNFNAGALIVNNTEFTATNCRFFGNTAGFGGGAFVDLLASQTARFDRCLFVDNTVTQGGGAISCSINDGNVVVNRCTMANSVAPDGSAVRALGHHITIANSIIWGNGPASPFSTSTGSVTVQYSDVEGGQPGIENLDLDPLFTDPANGFQYSLQPDSPCIDAGDPAHPLDEDGTVVDLGAIPTGSGSSALSGLGTKFLRGDVNGDGLVDLGDPIGLLDHLFGNALVTCADRADANDDGTLDLADPIRLLGYLFSGGENPAAPFPSCWWDGTVDGLRCSEVEVCP